MLAFTSQPSFVAAGQPVSPLTVVALDAAGDTVTSADIDVTISLGANPGGATLSGTTTVKAVSGVAKFPDLRMNKVGSGYTLVASSPNLASATTNAFSVSPGAAAAIVFTVQPTTAIARTPIPAFSVSVQDAGGNSVPTSAYRILITGPSGLTGNLLRQTDSNGAAIFTDVTILNPGNGYVLTATASPVGGGPPAFVANSSPFNMIVGPTAKLTFTGQPALTAPGAFLPPVLVAVTDAGGNVVTSENRSVTIALGANPGSGVLSGTTTRASVNGIATFADLKIDNASSGYTLVASASNLPPATSRKFSVRNSLVFRAISAGYFHSCGITLQNAAYCWGSNGDGQLGDSVPFEGRLTADPVVGGLSISNLVAGRTHNCAVTDTHIAYCWGYNGEQQLGSSVASSNVPVGVAGGLTFSSAAGGYAHSCGVTTAGMGFCWGDNSSGALGNGTLTMSGTPVPVSGSLVFSSISPGRYFTCGVTTSHTAYCWGNNGLGELGDGTTTAHLTPAPVLSQQHFAFVGAGGFFSCGLTDSGAAYCWGANDFGELGDGGVVNRSTPGPVTGGLTFVSLTVGNRHACGLTANGTAYCWGDHSSGALGIGGTAQLSTFPVPVAGGLTFSAISAGRFHTCGVTTSGAGYCWGLNQFGQLGDDTTLKQSVPVAVR
jgi:alpha-tubulin suppressor-like RCC1 family protein